MCSGSSILLRAGIAVLMLLRLDPSSLLHKTIVEVPPMITPAAAHAPTLADDDDVAEVNADA
jgi:hypothetical protein